MSKGRPVDQVPLYYAHSQLHMSWFLESSQSDEVLLLHHLLVTIYKIKLIYFKAQWTTGAHFIVVNMGQQHRFTDQKLWFTMKSTTLQSHYDIRGYHIPRVFHTAKNCTNNPNNELTEQPEQFEHRTGRTPHFERTARTRNSPSTKKIENFRTERTVRTPTVLDGPWISPY